MQQNSTKDHPRISAKRSLKGWVIGHTQTASARLCRVYLVLNAGYDVRNDVAFRDDKPYLFICNHQSRIDPFVTFAALSLSENFKIKPVRFMTARGIYFSPLRPILKLLGCYPTRRNGVDSVDLTTTFLREGFCVLIFPEGRRTLREESDPRPGVERIITAAPDTVVPILVHIEWDLKGAFRKKPIVHLTEATLVQLRGKNAKEIMQEVYKV